MRGRPQYSSPSRRAVSPRTASPAPHLPIGWESCFSPAHGRAYYAHRASGTTVWSLAEVHRRMQRGVVSPQPQPQPQRWSNNTSTTRINSVRRPLPSAPIETARRVDISSAGDIPQGWTAHYSAQHGRTYFGNAASGETMWSIKDTRREDAATSAAADVALAASVHRVDLPSRVASRPRSSHRRQQARATLAPSRVRAPASVPQPRSPKRPVHAVAAVLRSPPLALPVPRVEEVAAGSSSFPASFIPTTEAVDHVAALVRENASLRRQLKEAQRLLLKKSDGGGGSDNTAVLRKVHARKLAAHAVQRIKRRALAVGWDQWVAHCDAIFARTKTQRREARRRLETLSTAEHDTILKVHLSRFEDQFSLKASNLEAELARKSAELEAMHSEREDGHARRTRELDSTHALMSDALRETLARKEAEHAEVVASLEGRAKKNLMIRSARHERRKEKLREKEAFLRDSEKAHAETIDVVEAEFTRRGCELEEEHARKIFELEASHAKKSAELDALHDERTCELDHVHGQRESEREAHHGEAHRRVVGLLEEKHSKILEKLRAKEEAREAEHAELIALHEREHAQRDQARALAHADAERALHVEHADKSAELNLAHDIRVSETRKKLEMAHRARTISMEKTIENTERAHRDRARGTAMQLQRREEAVAMREQLLAEETMEKEKEEKKKGPQTTIEEEEEDEEKTATPQSMEPQVLLGKAIAQVMDWPTTAQTVATQWWEACGATVIPEAQWKMDPGRADFAVFYYDTTEADFFCDTWEIEAPECTFMTADEFSEEVQRYVAEEAAATRERLLGEEETTEKKKKKKKKTAPQTMEPQVLADKTLVQVLAWPTTGTQAAQTVATQWEACGAKVISEEQWMDDPDVADFAIFVNDDEEADDFCDVHELRCPDCTFMSFDEFGGEVKKYVAKVLAGEAIVQVLAWPGAHIAEKLAERWEAYGATVIPEAEWKKDPTRATYAVYFDVDNEETDDFYEDWSPHTDANFMNADDFAHHIEALAAAAEEKGAEEEEEEEEEED